MSFFERLLEPGCTELPACRCGKEMTVARIEAKSSNAHIRIYECQACDHELRLTVWNGEAAA